MADIRSINQKIEIPTEKEVDLTKDFISGGYDLLRWGSQVGYKILTGSEDRFWRDFGDQALEEMLKDPKVSSTIRLLKFAILGSSLSISPSEPDTFKKNYKRSEQIAQFVRINLSRIDVHLSKVIYEMLDSLIYGHKVSEITYDHRTYRPEKNRKVLALKSIKVKPQYTFAFVLDDYWNLVGFLSIPPSMGLVNTNPKNYLSLDGYTGELLPRKKFWLHAPYTKDSDPRGISVLLNVHRPFWMKAQAMPEYLRHLAQFGSPMLIGKTGPNAKPQPKRQNGAPIYGPDGKPIMLYPTEVLHEALKESRNGSIITVSHDSDVQVVQGGQQSSFLEAFRFFNEEISEGLTSQHLATGQGAEAGVRGDSSVHENRLGSVVQFLQSSICDSLLDDVIYPLVLYNYGQEAAEEFLPTASFAPPSRADMTKLASAVSSLWQGGDQRYLHPSQQARLDSMMGLPERVISEEEIAQQKAAAEQAATASAEENSIMEAFASL